MRKNFLKLLLIFIITIFASISLFRFIKYKSLSSDFQITDNKNVIDFFIEKKVEVPKITINSDKDNDGILDLDDIVEGARKDVLNKPRYIDKYYNGGYPPANEGVCTDVVWRAFKNAGYNFKDMIDTDIKNNLEDYPRIRGEAPDPNIDFRRVPNLISFFKKYGIELTTEVIPEDVENLKEWQGGDVVMFDRPFEHVAIVSDKRNGDGVPYIIHNAGPYTREDDVLLFWVENVSKITHHFRFPTVD